MWGEFDVDDSTCLPHWGEFKKDQCTASGKRQYSAVLHDIPPGISWESTCANMPADMDGHHFDRPRECKNTGTDIWGEFDVDDSTCLPQEEVIKEPDPIDELVGETWQSPGIPPPHQDAYSTPNVALMSNEALWELITQADPDGHRVLVFLKLPDLQRGFFKGTSLINNDAFVA